MTWVKLDDGFWSNRKVRRAAESVAAYVRLLSYSGSEETDGVIPHDDVEWICVGLGDVPEHIATLLDVGLIEQHGKGYDSVYVIPDFLEFNFSHDQLEQRRNRDRARKLGQSPTAAPPGGLHADSGRNPGGLPTDSTQTPGGIRTESKRNPKRVFADSLAPDPTRPDPVTTPLPPSTQKPAAAPFGNPCPRCHAPTGQPCTQPNGRPSKPHASRLKPAKPPRDPDTHPIPPAPVPYGHTDPNHPPDCRCQGTGWYYATDDANGVTPCPGPPDAIVTTLRAIQ